MSVGRPWASWDAFASAIEPRYVERGPFEVTRRRAPLVVRELSAYGFGKVRGLIGCCSDAIELWASVSGGLITFPAEARMAHSLVVNLARTSCMRLEEVLSLTGDVPRLRTLLRATRRLSELVEKHAHSAAKSLVLEVAALARECWIDLMERSVAAARALDEDLMLARMPANLRPYFEEARDILLLRNCDLGAFAAARGLERACRDAAARFNLMLVERANGAARALAECDLNDVLEMLSRCVWSDGSEVIDRPARALGQFVRQMRNVSGHAGTSSVEEWRATAVLAAGAACRLSERASEPNQSIAPTELRRSW